MFRIVNGFLGLQMLKDFLQKELAKKLSEERYWNQNGMLDFNLGHVLLKDVSFGMEVKNLVSIHQVLLLIIMLRLEKKGTN